MENKYNRNVRARECPAHDTTTMTVVPGKSCCSTRNSVICRTSFIKTRSQSEVFRGCFRAPYELFLRFDRGSKSLPLLAVSCSGRRQNKTPQQTESAQPNKVRSSLFALVFHSHFVLTWDSKQYPGCFLVGWCYYCSCSFRQRSCRLSAILRMYSKSTLHAAGSNMSCRYPAFQFGTQAEELTLKTSEQR